MTHIDEIRYRLLKALELNPHISQRELAKDLGISLGKTNYCLNALITRGWVKVKNFQRSHNKRAYMYCLTSIGIEQKAKMTLWFLKQKMLEYEILQREIRILMYESRNLLTEEDFPG